MKNIVALFALLALVVVAGCIKQTTEISGGTQVQTGGGDSETQDLVPVENQPVNDGFPEDGYTLTTDSGACFDSDSGRTYDESGYVIDAKKVRHDDSCNGNTVTEYHCTELGNNLYDSSTKLCDKCENGKCVAVEKESQCSETDRGIDYGTRGTVKDIAGVTYEDSCDTAKNLKEYYCDSYDYGKSKFYLCENGCLEGACA